MGDFIDMLKKEDKGIDRVAMHSREAIRIASSTSIEQLLEEDFALIINDHSYSVKCPKVERVTGEHAKKYVS